MTNYLTAATSFIMCLLKSLVNISATDNVKNSQGFDPGSSVITRPNCVICEL